ncbi:MAG: hypothetical protein H9536_11200 [Aphanizomenon flos-aquae Clear-A1]|nr:hypothetical protein [Aphanizomenon flos-aquae Clear-A1]
MAKKYISLKDYQDVFSRIEPQTFEYKTLVLLKYPQIQFKKDLTKRDGKLWLENESYDLPEELKYLDDGPIYSDGEKGINKSTEKTFSMSINKHLKTLFNNNDATVSLVKLIFAQQDTGTYLVNKTDIQTVNLKEFKFDKDIKSIIEEYTPLYVQKPKEPNNSDKYKEGSYPFFVIHIPAYDKYLQYNVYRYVAQLPYYVRLTSDYRLPVIDHIYRDPKDNRRNKMRFCTHWQNLMNQCSTGTTPYHGVNDRGSITMPKTGKNQENSEKVWHVALYCCNLLAASYDILPETEQTKYKYLSTTSCKPISIFGNKASYIDTFINETVKLCKTTKHNYNTFTKASDVPDTEFKKLPTLQQLKQATPPDTPIKKTFKAYHVGALVNDITRYVAHGEYCHTNFFKAAKPTTTVQQIFTNKPTYRPEEILNFYETHCSQESLDKYCKRMGLPQEVQGKKKWFTKRQDPETKKYIIECHFVDSVIPCNCVFDKVVVDNVCDTTVITSPFTMYKQVEQGLYD